jgi:3-hydroxyisobutyrate dehydrogenase-like beta-hydroxyacid dehydrogenase
MDGSTVTVIGLGAMGSALVRSLIGARHGVTVWNRTSAKSDEMVELGAEAAPSVADAIDANDVVVVCVRGYSAAEEIFRPPEVVALLDGKTVIQLGTGTPTEVTEAAAWFADRGSRYVDGAIMDFPEQVGTPECQVLVSGDPVAFEQCSWVLDTFGGDIRYLGEDPAASAVVNTAALAYVYATSHAFLGAAAMCDVSDAPLELLGEVVAKFTTQMPSLFEEYVAMITARSYDSKTLRLATGAENLEAVIDFGRQAGVDTGLFESALHSFRAAADQDVGVNLAATYEVLRRPHD